MEKFHEETRLYVDSEGQKISSSRNGEGRGDRMRVVIHDSKYILRTFCVLWNVLDAEKMFLLKKGEVPKR